MDVGKLYLKLGLLVMAVTTSAWTQTLSEAQFEKVVSHIVQHVVENRSLEISAEELAMQTGVHLDLSQASNDLHRAIVARLKSTEQGRVSLNTATRGASCGPTERRCAQYGACSLFSDLSGASDEIRAMYRRERAEDGKRYSDFPLPAFSARNLQDQLVHSDELGEPTVLAFLAVHCSHSHNSIAILDELDTKYSSVRFIGIMVNSGSVAEINKWLPGAYDPKFEIWVYPDDSLGDIVSSHLVPTYLLTDPHGNVLQKLVGYQTRTRLEQVIGALF